MILLLCQLFLDTISPYIKNICLQILTVFSFGGVFCAARQNQAVSFLYWIFPLPACLGLCPSALADSSHPSLLAGTSHRVFASSAHPKNFRQAAPKTSKSCRIRHHLILFCSWRSTLAFTKPCLGATLCFNGQMFPNFTRPCFFRHWHTFSSGFPIFCPDLCRTSPEPFSCGCKALLKPPQDFPPAFLPGCWRSVLRWRQSSPCGF